MKRRVEHEIANARPAKERFGQRRSRDETSGVLSNQGRDRQRRVGCRMVHDESPSRDAARRRANEWFAEHAKDAGSVTLVTTAMNGSARTTAGRIRCRVTSAA